MRHGERAEPRDQVVARVLDVGQQVVAQHDLEHLLADLRRDGVAAEGIEVAGVFCKP